MEFFSRARKEEKSSAEKERKNKEIEDAKWRDDDKNLAKKLAKKEEAERKRQEALEKKREKESILAQEEAEQKAMSAKKGGQTQKMSRAQIREEAERREAIARGKAAVETKTHLDAPLEENVNRVQVEGVEARTVDEALSVLRYLHILKKQKSTNITLFISVSKMSRPKLICIQKNE